MSTILVAVFTGYLLFGLFAIFGLVHSLHITNLKHERINDIMGKVWDYGMVIYTSISIIALAIAYVNK